MSAATMNEMERLRRERDEVIAEREALAVYVERLRDDLQEYHDQYGDEPIARKHDMGAALKEEPTTLLARLKAEWQADALESLAADAHPHIRIWLKDEAKKLRRQAEEPTNGHH